MIETSFAMRGTTSVILQLHQKLRLPWKMSLRIDRAHIWNVIYHAWSNSIHLPTSPNNAPATQNESHDWSRLTYETSFTMRGAARVSPNFTKCCACHAKWISWLIHLTYEASFTTRRASKVTLPTHQVLHLPRKMNLSIDPPHIWNVIYNKRNNKRHPPTPPNTAPATKNESQDWSCSHLKRHLPCVEQQHPPSPNNTPATENDTHDWSCSHLKRHLQCAEQQHSPSNLTKYCACHAKWHSKIWRKSTENGWSVIYNARPTIIRAWNCKTEPACSWSLFFSLGKAFNSVLKITTFRALAIYPNFTKYCACHEKSQSTITKCCACHEQWHSDITKYCACHEKWHSNHQMLRLPRKVTLQRHQILCLPRRVTELLLSWTVFTVAAQNSWPQVPTCSTSGASSTMWGSTLATFVAEMAMYTTCAACLLLA